MKKILLGCVLLAAFTLSSVANANAIVIGNKNNLSDSCYPFGCATGDGHYQQVYSINYFSSPINIAGIRLFGADYPHWENGKVPSLGHFTITLSSSQKWGRPMSDNVGWDRVVVYDGQLPSLSRDGNLVIPFTTNFRYDPTAGRDLDLLMDISWTNATSAFRPVYFVSDNSTWSQLDGRENFSLNLGAVTEFLAVPEPTSVALMTLGVIGLGISRRKRNDFRPLIALGS